jgi:hypothetical protein
MSPSRKAKPTRHRKPSPLRDRMWKAIRQLRSFEVTQLAIATEATRGTALRFTRELRRGGYVRQMPRLKFRIVRDTGPKAPVLIRNEECHQIGMWDRNECIAYGVDGNAPPEKFWLHWPPALHKVALTPGKLMKRASK